MVFSKEVQLPDVPSSLKHPQLDVAVEAALQGARIVADYFYRGVEIRSKESFNLVTDADVHAEQRIAEVIRASFPEHSILGEEQHSDSVEAEHLWIVDPLDGTNNFAHQIPHFAVSIGYYHRGVSQVGVIVNPVTSDWFYCVRGQGAWYRGERTSVSSEMRLEKSMIGIGFYYDRGVMMEATLMAIRDFFRENIHGVRRFGTASLDLCQVGLGRYGTYFEYQLHPWDFAAGKLFVEESGGMVSTCEGLEIPIARTSCLASNKHLHPAALEITRRYWVNERPRLPAGGAHFTQS
jgi:myo-inositol-1(or 4)-monophosphatase